MSVAEAATMTPLERDVRKRIAAAGPMPVAQYMALCLGDPQHGYYTTRDPLGAHGDFTTAPEVSQMFGELIGLWMATVWKQMGAPENVRLVELGPGRGTLMADALRAAKVVPEFLAAAVLHLVETSPVLQAQQEKTLAPLNVSALWHTTLADVPGGPSIIIANEFFDALPVQQAVKKADGWHMRTVAIGDDGALTFSHERTSLKTFECTLPARLRSAREDEIFEWRSDTAALELGRHLREPGAALVIDYGHIESATGDTLQAVGRHSFADPLSTPGDVDLTAHVDFEWLADQVECMGATVHGPVTQAHFLAKLGIDARAKTLRKGATPSKAAEIDAALDRLTGHGRTGMGSLFKVIGFAHKSVGTLPGFEP